MRFIYAFLILFVLYIDGVKNEETVEELPAWQNNEDQQDLNENEDQKGRKHRKPLYERTFANLFKKSGGIGGGGGAYRNDDSGEQVETKSYAAIFQDLTAKVNMFATRYIVPLFKVLTGILTGKMPKIEQTDNPFTKH